MKFTMLTYLLLASRCLLSQVTSDYSEVDAYIRNAPKSYKHAEEIASYIMEKPSSEIEKARMIYVWLAENIAYDDAGYNSKKLGDNSAEEVLRTRVGVCAGYANAFQSIGEKVGLEIIKIIGCAKGYDYESDISDNVEESSNHAWNAIRIDGTWAIYDATWGSGAGMTNKKGKLVSVKEFTGDWFQVDPKIAIYTHFPINDAQQYLEKPIAFLRYTEMPRIGPEAFKRQWLNPDEVLLMAQSKNPMDFASYYEAIHHGTILAPSARLLKKGKPNSFEIRTDEVKNIFLMNSDEEWIPFNVADGVYSYVLNTKIPGDYNIVVHLKDNEYHTLLSYQIE